MIRAEKHPVLDKVIYWFFRRLTRSHFHAVYVAGADEIRQADGDRPVIAYANHSNWWDGIVLLLLTRLQRGKDFYCMMEEKQMQHYPFFRWLGAFSVDLGSRVRSAAAVRYAIRLLDSPRSFIWLFPQGKMVKASDPVEIMPGTDFLARKCPRAVMIPAVFRFQFGREQKPEIFIRIGTGYAAHENSAERMEKELKRLLDELDADLRDGMIESYEQLLSPRLSINKWWELLFRVLRGKWKGFEAGN